MDGVTRHKLGGSDGRHVTVTTHARLGNDERLQTSQRPTGPPLGEEADGGVEKQRGEDDEAFHHLAEPHGHPGGGEQQQHDEALELGEGQAPQ
jgi:hypothetical protein